MKRISFRGVVEEQEKDQSGALAVPVLFYSFINK